MNLILKSKETIWAGSTVAETEKVVTNELLLSILSAMLSEIRFIPIRKN